MPGIGHQFSDILQMACEVWWDGRIVDDTHEGAGGRERADSRLASAPDTAIPYLGLWFVLSVPAQCARFWLEPQAGIPDIPRTGTEPAPQAAQTAGSLDTRPPDRAGQCQSTVVSGFHARSTR